MRLPLPGFGIWAARRGRSGAVTLELAIAFPVMLFLTFGMIEFGQFLYIKHCFEAAARDGMRVAILSTATQTQVTNAMTNTLAQANVTYNSSWLTLTDLGPSGSGTVTDVSTVPMGDELQLTLSTSYNSIPNVVRPLYSMTGIGIGNGKPVVGMCTMIKE